MTEPKPPAFLLLVTGSTRAGKSTLTKGLVQRFTAEGLTVERIEQDDRSIRKSSPDHNRTLEGKVTWEGPHFTKWHELLHRIAAARKSGADLVIAEGYLILDAFQHDEEGVLNGPRGVLWLDSTKELVMQRRTQFPNRSRIGEKGWATAAEYAAKCCWPVHLEYVQRVQEYLDSSSRMVHLPADDAIPARLGRAAAVVRGWLPEARPPTPPTAEHSEAAEPPPKRARGGPSRHEVIDLT